MELKRLLPRPQTVSPFRTAVYSARETDFSTTSNAFSCVLVSWAVFQLQNHAWKHPNVLGTHPMSLAIPDLMIAIPMPCAAFEHVHGDPLSVSQPHHIAQGFAFCLARTG